MRSSGIVRTKLQENGWTFFRATQGGEQWTRPGKSIGVSGLLDVETFRFFCFSSNAAPLDENGNYTPLQLVAAFEFGGDERAAAKEYARRRNDSQIPTVPTSLAFELSGGKNGESGERKTKIASEKSNVSRGEKTVEFPSELFQCGGLLQAIQEFSNSISIRIQPELAFAGSLALLSFLVGRKIKTDRGKTTPNLHIVGLGGASSGKNAAREANRKILSSVDLEGYVVEKFESVQALQNAICAQKKILLQQDEFGQELQTTSIKSGANRFGIISEMLKLFSNAGNEKYLPRVVAADYSKPKEEPRSAAFPYLTLYGTTNYRDFTDSINGALLRNGFVARTLIVAGRVYSPKRSIGFDEAQLDRSEEVPTALTERVLDWAKFRDVKDFETPELFEVPFDRDAFELLREYESTEIEPSVEAAANDANGLAEFLGRAAEKMRKYALLFAASKFGPNESTLKIDLECARFATILSRYETELFRNLLGTEIVESESQRNVVAVKKWVDSLENGFFWRSDFTVRFARLGKRERDEVLQTLIESEYLEEGRATKNGSQKSSVCYFTNDDRLNSNAENAAEENQEEKETKG